MSTDYDYAKFRERLKSLRESHGLTLEQVGDKLGITKSSYLRLEEEDRKRINKDYVKKLADYYGVNPIWLMGYDAPMRLPSGIEQELMREISDYMSANSFSARELYKVERYCKKIVSDRSAGRSKI